MPAKRTAARPIGEVVRGLFEDLERVKELTREDIDAHWKAAAGESGARHSRPALIRKTVLTVHVDSSGWLQDLSMRKREILKGLKRMLGKDKITEIQFKIGEF